jgi:hypothetical protein
VRLRQQPAPGIVSSSSSAKAEDPRLSFSGEAVKAWMLGLRRA